MATAANPQPPRHSDGQFVKYDQYIEQQVGKARSQVKSVELFSELLLLSVGVLMYLLVFVLLDHWVFASGLGMFGRTLALLGLLGGLGAVVWFRLLPVLMGRVNPIYAADCIERSQPSLKNSLINFLLLRRSRTPMAKAVYEAIEQRAATDLSQVEVGSSVDRTRLIRIFYVLMALVAFSCVYKLISPKDPLVSLGRVILPWMDVAAPTRVTIQEVTPGDGTAFTGQIVKVTALVTGIDEDEDVTLHYSTVDGSVDDKQIKLVKPTDGYRHEARLPEGTDGLGQDVDYYLVAGDIRTPIFHLSVQPPPTISVQSVFYDYPRYTDLGRREVPWKGDIKAVEGTQVSIKAETNQPIKSAVIDFNCDGRTLLPMRVEGQKAYATFTLSEKTAEFHSYLLRFRNTDGHTNPSPTRYQIEVVRDKPPTLEFTQPGKDIELPANSAVLLKLLAADQDFKLSKVRLFVNKGEQVYLGTRTEPGEELLRNGAVPSFEGTYLVNAAKLGLSPGDELSYWAVATDNKSPGPNIVESQRWKIKIVDSQNQPQPPDQLAKNEPRKTDPQPPAGQQPNGAEPQKGQPQESNPQGGNEPSDQGDQPQDSQQQPDPENDPSRAIEELSKLFEKKQPKDEQEQEQHAKNDSQDQGDSDVDNKRGGSSEGNNGKQKQQDKNSKGSQPKDNPGQGKGSQSSSGDQKKEEGTDPKNGKQKQQPGDTQQPDQGKQGKGNQPEQPKDGSGKQQPDKKGQPQGAGKQGNEKGEPQKQPGQSKGGAGQPGKEKSKKNNGDQSQSGDQKGNNPNQSGSKKGDAPKGDPKNNGAEESGQPQGDQADQKGNPQGKGAGETKPGDAGKANPKQGKSGEEESTDGDREKLAGDTAGDGKQSDDKGSPAQQGKNNPRDKKANARDENKKANEKAPDVKNTSISDHESNSQGDQGGDRSGGGEQGGGQRAPKQGQGAAGQSTPSETGGGKGPGSGDADKVNRAGNKAPSGSKTGTSGSDQPGNGSRTKQSPDGKGDGENPNSPSGGSRGKQGQPKEVSTDKDVDKGQQAGSGGASGTAKSGPGGQGAGNPSPGNDRQNNNRQNASGTGTTKRDEVNLEYAKKAVDLMLRSIDEELAKDQLSPELQQRGYTREQLESLQKKFRSLRDKAKSPDATAADRKAFDDTLRSLGLSPSSTIDSRGTPTVRNRNREGISVPPPPEYRNRVNSFKSNISKPLE